MTLSERQRIFMHNLGKLIIFAYENGIELTGGELWRPVEMQEIYFEKGLSKTMKGKHLIKLAIDLNVFIDGIYRTDAEAHKPLAEYWKSLHPENTCGYFWGWDFNHYQMG